jgi:hypothetical protein
MPPKSRTTQNSLLAAGLAPAREDPSPIVSTFARFTQHRASTHGTAHSISELVERPHPETPSLSYSVPEPDSSGPADPFRSRLHFLESPLVCASFYPYVPGPS